MTDTSNAKRRFPVWAKVLLGVSLAVNFAVLGLFLGITSRVGSSPFGPAASAYALPYIVALPKEDRRAIGQGMREAVRNGEVTSRRERRGRYVEMISVITNERWDEARAQEIMARQASESSAVQDMARQMWLQRMENMSLEERQSYAKRLREFLRRGPKRRKRQ